MSWSRHIAPLAAIAFATATALAFAAATASADPWGADWPRKSESVVATYPDAFERALDSRISTSQSAVTGHHHDRVGPSAGRPPIFVTRSDGGLEWPQVGIGFGLGAVVALGLMLSVRALRLRELVH